MHFQSRNLLVATSLLFLASGCGAQVRSAAAEAPRIAVPITIDEALKAGEDARTRERVAAVLATPEMQRAIEAVARAAVAGGIDEVAGPDRDKRIAELMDVVARALAENIRRDILPAAAAGARDAMATLVTKEDLKALQGAVAAAAATAVSSALRTAANEIPSTVAPAARESLVKELQAPDLHIALDGLVDELAKQAVATSRESLNVARAQNVAEGHAGPTDILRRMVTVSWVMTGGFVVVGAALAFFLLRTRRQASRFRAAMVELLLHEKKVEREGAPRDDTAHVDRLLELLQ